MTSEGKRNYIMQAWLVILLGLLYGVGLAGMQVALSGRIEENKKNEAYLVIPVIVPGADVGQTTEYHLKNEPEGKEVLVYQARDEQGDLVGWVIPASGQGFADRIEMLVGLSADLSTLTGIYVIDQKETPGLGNYITEADFRGSFVGLSADPSRPVTVVQGNASPESNTVRSLTGATISSVSVANIVNQVVETVKPALEARAGD